MPTYLRPTNRIAPCALLPGDPGRALALAQDLLTAPRMSNHHRGLWGYSGETHAGDPLTIQSTGIGGPSTAAVLRELVELGVRRAVRIGTCRALSARLDPGRLLVARDALAGDGTSRAIGAAGVVEAPGRLTEALEAAGRPAAAGRVASADLFYRDEAVAVDRDPALGLDAWREQGAIAIDLATAPLFALARRLRIEAGSLLTVTGDLDPDGRELKPEALSRAELQMGRIGSEALAESSSTAASWPPRAAATGPQDEVEPSSTSSRD